MKPKHPIYSENFTYSVPEIFRRDAKSTYWIRSVTDKYGMCIWEVGIEADWNIDGFVAYCGRFQNRESAIAHYAST